LDEIINLYNLTELICFENQLTTLKKE
jgi:hypothetical protein